MHPALQRVLSQFDEPCAIIGSAARDYDSAHDIDVLFLVDDRGWRRIMDEFRLRYNGWDHPEFGYHVRRANFKLLGIPKNIQLITMSYLKEFSDYPFCCILQDGTILHEGQFYKKEPRGQRHPGVVRGGGE